MASITIRRLDDEVKTRLRIRAARHGVSLEEEARHLLSAALKKEPKRPTNLAEAIRRRIGRQALLSLTRGQHFDSTQNLRL